MDLPMHGGGKPGLLFGGTSVLGFTLARDFADLVQPVANPHNRALAPQTWERARLDQAGEVEALFAQSRHELILYAHAICNVGTCERHPDWAWRMNVRALQLVLAHVPAAARFVYISSDHVFGGDGTYSESSAPAPISVYGRSRVAAEQLVLQRRGALVVRCGLPIGASLNGRTGFYDWLRYRSERGLPITVIADEWRSAAWAGDMARRIVALAASTAGGIRHIPALRPVARPQLATFLLTQQGLAARFAMRKRADQPHPHLGYVELATDFDDELAAPLDGVVTARDGIVSRR